MRKTKIICTLGPASDSEEMIRKLISAGMNVARFNFSHGTHEEQLEKYRTLCKVRKELGLPVAALLDTKGPEIRLRDFEGGKITLEKGQQFTLTTEECMGTQEKASVTYKGLPHDVREGGSILIDDGLIELHVDRVAGSDIVCTVVNGGPVSNHKGVNVPGADLTMPFISPQDRSDIEFGCANGFDMIAASFTRTADDIREIRYILHNNNSNMKMIQKKIIKLAESKGKMCVTATQMLDSMIHNPRPTRAETTDVANAIYDGTTAIMLSGETANGAYPVEAVSTMAKIAERTEQDIDYKSRMMKRVMGETGDSDVTKAISHATCTIADDVHADAIITVTMSGRTAASLANFKPTAPIIACTPSEQVACQMNLLFDTTPVVIGQEPSADLLFEAAINSAKSAHLVSSGDRVVLTAGVPLGVSGNTNMIRVIEVW